MLFTRDKEFYKSLLRLALPIALQNLISFSAGIIDSIMAGSLGEGAVAGIYMGNQISSLLTVLMGGIEGTVLILLARYSGSDDRESISGLFSISLGLSLLLSAAVSAVALFAPRFTVSLFARDPSAIEDGAAYLFALAFSFVPYALSHTGMMAVRSVGCARVGMYISLLGLAVKAGLNLALVPSLGIGGAALATVACRIAEAIVMAAYIFFFDKKIKLRPSELIHYNKQLFAEFVKYGLPIMSSQVVWAINTLGGSAIIGANKTEGAIAAVGIAGTLNMLGFVVLNGIAGAVGIVISRTIGEGRRELLREYSYTSQLIAAAVGILVFAAMYFSRSAFLSLYGVTEAAAEQALSLITVLAATAPFTAYQSVALTGIVKSGGDVGFILKNDAFFVFLAVLPSALIASRLGAPLWVIFLCLKSDQVLKCISAAVKVRRFDWVKEVCSERRTG